MEEPGFTLHEITQQSSVWKKVYQIVRKDRFVLKDILSGLMGHPGSEVIFTGAGSSFFVGEMVAGFFQKNTLISAKAVSSTEIVTHPDIYINPFRNTLLVSFARSGNSPESVAAVDLADQVSSRISHLIITCNPEGQLSQRASHANSHVLTMPEESHDKGLAMTSSVTSMALAALLFSRIGAIDQLQEQVVLAAGYADTIIREYSDRIRQAAALDFKRAVFLGSGPLCGAAREGHLKLQEMTDGKVICKFDSFLAFRHGPKVVVDENTLVFYMFSNDPYVHRYEMDLAAAIRKEHRPIHIMGVSESPPGREVCDFAMHMTGGGRQLDEDFLPVCSLVAAQLLGYYKSVQLGFNPDSPSASGAIHRVVQGVTIYGYHQESELSNG